MNPMDRGPRLYTPDRLRAALHEVGGTTGLVSLDDIVARAAHTRQRPAWTFPERWLPMSVAVPHEGVPRTALLLALILLSVVLVGTAVMATGGLRWSPAPPVVTNGLIAYGRDGDIFGQRLGGEEEIELAVGPGDQIALSFSPDGTRIAYWSNASTAQGDLVVANADGTEPVTIASHDAAPDKPASWSPDGSRLVYEVGGRLYIAPVDGSGPIEVGDPALVARPPSWSPTGESIAFGAADAREPTIYRLHLMDADGTNVRQVSDVRGNGFAFIQTRWSRDGTKVAAQASDAADLEEWDIWIIDVRDGTATDIGAHVGGDELFPSWAPDRDALIWSHATPVLLEPGADPLDLPTTAGTRFSPDGRLLMGHGAVGGPLVVTDLTGAIQGSIAEVSAMFDWQPLYGD